LARQHAAQGRLANTVDELRQKYGSAILQRGHDLILRAKDGRGHEPGKANDLGAPASRRRVQSFEGSKLAGETPALPGSAPHNLAIVQRQRIGNSFTRVTASIGPELRFRIATQPSTAPKSNGAKSLATRHSSLTSTYVPLNVHSYYSFLDSTLSPSGDG
jgi:hypothetical protein